MKKTNFQKWFEKSPWTQGSLALYLTEQTGEYVHQVQVSAWLRGAYNLRSPKVKKAIAAITDGGVTW